MTKHPNPPTLEELKRRGDSVMAQANQAIIEARQTAEEARKIRERVRAA